ncbi:hypothetical protein M8J75_006262 [Diaphorina citri]|nr:hypothetical protein M8J75_006262 [Diaphorina citri]
MPHISNRDLCLYSWIGEIDTYEDYIRMNVMHSGPLLKIGNFENIAEVLTRNPDVLNRKEFEESRKRLRHVLSPHRFLKGTPNGSRK